MFENADNNQQQPVQPPSPQPQQAGGRPSIETVTPPAQAVQPAGMPAPQAMPQAEGMQQGMPQASGQPMTTEAATEQATGPTQVYTMPEKYLPAAGAQSSGSSGNKRFLIGIGVAFAVFVIVLAVAVYFLLPYLQTSQPTTATPTAAVNQPANANAAANTNAANANEDTDANANSNENTNSGLSLNFNVNEDLEANVNSELFGNENANTNSNSNGNSNATSVFLDRSDARTARDKDKDGLTDQEEELYDTTFNLPDSDGDGFVDGTELVGLFAPDKADSPLSESGIVTEFTNDTFGWSIYYPSKWLAESIDASDTQVFFTSESVDGELVEVTVVENEEGQTAAEWFASLYSDIEATDLEETEVAGLGGIVSPDGYTYYIADSKYIIGINYNFGTKEIVNFQSTFEMMVKSFLYTAAKPAATNSNTNAANANDNTNAANVNAANTNAAADANSNTNASTNTNTNANSNTNVNQNEA